MPAPIGTVVKAAMLAATLLALPAGGALAGDTATTIDDVTLRLGPGVKYDVVSSMPEGTDVTVERCTMRWCRIDHQGNRGWAGIHDLGFGTSVGNGFFPPQLERTLRGSGTICFHTGDNFTGESVCSRSGRVVSDLALYGYDNAFHSVSVEGDVSAHVCREFNFGSWCETISSDEPHLSRFLHGAVSSYRVW